MIDNGAQPSSEEQDEAKTIHLLQLWINLYIHNVAQFGIILGGTGLDYETLASLVHEIFTDDSKAMEIIRNNQTVKDNIPFTLNEAKGIFLSSLGASLLTVCPPGRSVTKTLAEDCDALILKIMTKDTVGATPLDFMYFLNRRADGATAIIPILKEKIDGMDKDDSPPSNS